MIRHHVLFTFREDVPGQVRGSVVEAMHTLLASQRHSTSWWVGRDEGLVPGNASVVLAIDFADAQAFFAFQASQEHQDLLRRITPLVASRAAAQCRLP
jgi:hypothetical protein